VKVSPIGSWLSRPLVRVRLDKNSVRSTRSTSFNIFLLTASMRSMHMTYFQGEFFRQGGRHHGRMRLVDLAQNDGDGLRVFIFQKISEDLFIPIIKLAPHRATRGTTDFFHDVADPILAEDLRQHRLGTDHRA
jgi:hypothetical protein